MNYKHKQTGKVINETNYWLLSDKERLNYETTFEEVDEEDLAEWFNDDEI